VVQKIQSDQPQMVLIIPDWRDQPWYQAVWKFVKRYHYFPSNTAVFELDHQEVPPTRWGVWALLLEAQKQQQSQKEKAKDYQRNESSRRRWRRRKLRDTMDEAESW
jgi:hypothetical protein